MNNITMNNGTANKGVTFARAVFLMAQDPDTNHWDPLAYFPDMTWNDGNKVSYMKGYGFGPCCEAFALLDCIAPRKHEMAAVARLHKELKGMGYIITALDSNEWVKSHGERKIELDHNVYEATAITDNMPTAIRNKAKRGEAYAA